MAKLIQKYFSCLKLNARVARLAVEDRWMRSSDIGASYDRLAPMYNSSWQTHLKGVTDNLLAKLPDSLPSGFRVLDLGCGTGYSSGVIADRYPESPVNCIDVSSGMLDEASSAHVKKKNLFFTKADMLDYLRRDASESSALVFSAWAAGYSEPYKVLKESARVLAADGTLAVIMNLADTLKPVFNAYRKTMLRYPEKVDMALWPRFPESAAAVRKKLVQNNFKIETFEENSVRVPVRRDEDGKILPWLLNTGILAGFDRVMPLAHDPEVSKCFEECMGKDDFFLEHHYVLFMGRIQK